VWSLGQAAGSDGLTLVRIRGEVLLFIEAATSVGDGFIQYALGICDVSENAAGIGVTAIPAPLTDVAWDGWIWHHSGAGIISLTTTEEGNTGTAVIRIPIDNKAMRKTPATNVLVGVIELGTEVGAPIVRMSANTRILDKLA